MWDEAPTLSIVVPAFNEAPRIQGRAGLLNEAAAAGDIDPRATDLIVVDDGSTDDTARVAQRLLAPVFPRLRVLQLKKNSGKGAAVRVGAGAAAAPFVVFMDADMSVDPAQIPLLLTAMESSDLAIGSRSMIDSTIQSHSRHRVVMGRTFNFVANALTDVGLKDTQCGFKAFRTPLARILFHLMMVDRFAFDVEVLYLARQFGMKISEVPVEWREAEHSTVRPMSDSLSMAADVLRIRWRKKRPYIPALIVQAGSGHDDEASAHALSAASATFRKTDPVVPLEQGRALILLPLCKPDEIEGTTTRLRHPSTNLSVRKKLVSTAELMQMMPFPLGSSGNVVEAGAAASDRPRSERRHASRIAGHVRHYPRSETHPLFSLDV
jgi:dolichyl-phosphate beta-glucosyltransferase